MDGFFFAPTTRNYAEMLQGSDSANGVGKQMDGTVKQTDSAGGVSGQAAGRGSFAETVQEKLDEKEHNRCGSRRRDSIRNKKKKQKERERSLLEKRAKRRKLYMDLAQKAWYKHENELKFQEQLAFGRKEVSSAILKQHAIERATGERTELDANPAVLSEAATRLAQSYVFFKIPSARVNPRPKGMR